MKIIQDKDILHQKSEKVNMNDSKEIQMLNTALTTTFYQYNQAMQGLAAIQINICKRAILIRWDKGSQPEIFLNPRVWLKLGIRFSDEGCLSEGKNNRWIVTRPLFVLFSYYDLIGEKHTRFLCPKRARILMHEYDHLSGILLEDKGIKV